MQHPDEGTIHAWLDGALDAEESATVAAHVDACPECAERVREARGLIARASRTVAATDWGVGAGVPDASERRFAAPPPVRRARRWFTPARSAAAAVLLVAAGTVVVAREAGRDAAPVPRATSEVVPVRGGAAAAIMIDSTATAEAPPAASKTPRAARAIAPTAVRPRAMTEQRVARVPDESRPAVAAPAAAAPLAAQVAVAAKARPESARVEVVRATGAERARSRISSAEDIARAPAAVPTPAPSPAASANAFRSLAAPIAMRCYEVEADSLPPSLPRRFVLAPPDRVLGANGAAIVGASWRASRPSSVDVTFGRVAADSGAVLHVVETDGVVVATVGEGSGARALTTRRCE